MYAFLRVFTITTARLPLETVGRCTRAVRWRTFRHHTLHYLFAARAGERGLR